MDLFSDLKLIFTSLRIIGAFQQKLGSFAVSGMYELDKQHPREILFKI